MPVSYLSREDYPADHLWWHNHRFPTAASNKRPKENALLFSFPPISALQITPASKFHYFSVFLRPLSEVFSQSQTRSRYPMSTCQQHETPASTWIGKKEFHSRLHGNDLNSKLIGFQASAQKMAFPPSGTSSRVSQFSFPILQDRPRRSSRCPSMINISRNSRQ